jgi:PAS domain S-box-containing protein
VKKPSYQELTDKVRELKNESRERKRAEKKLVEKQSLLENQNIKLVQKSIELSDLMRELEDKNYELELIRSKLRKENVDIVRKSIELSYVMRKLEDKNYDLEQFQTELEKTMISLQESELRFRNFVEASPDLLFSMTKNGYIKYASLKTKELYGYSQDELIGKHLRITTPAKELPKAIKALKKVYSGRVLDGLLIMQKTKDGDEFPAEINAVPIEINGKIVGAQGVLRDITEQLRTQEEIKASLKEKEILLKEVHHRVKNNMQIISSLLRLQSAGIQDERILDKFKVSQNRIRSLALIHERLYRSTDFTKIDFADYCRNLTTSLFRSYSVDTNRVKLIQEIKSVFLDLNRAIPCGLLINELLSNALKHAFPNGRKGEVLISILTNNKSKYTLLVKDNGVGLPEDFDIFNTDSLGMQLVGDLTSQIGGKLKVLKTEGTAIQVVF